MSTLQQVCSRAHFTKRPGTAQAEGEKETEPGGAGGPLALALPLEKQLWWEREEQVGPRLPTQPQALGFFPTPEGAGPRKSPGQAPVTQAPG